MTKVDGFRKLARWPRVCSMWWTHDPSVFFNSQSYWCSVGSA